LPDTQYYWRVRAYDGFEYSPWTATTALLTRGGIALQVPHEYATIREAIDDAVDGDTVRVGPGTFAVSFAFAGKLVNVLGAGAEYTTLVPANPDMIMVDFSGPVDSSAKFSGFTVTGTSNNCFLVIRDYSHPIISDNIFHDCSGPMVINIASSGRGIIRHNLFYNNGGESCIGSIDGDIAIQIVNNTFDSNNRGIHSAYGDNGGWIQNNIITNSTEYGIYGKFNGIDYNCNWNNNPNYTASAYAGPGEINVDPQFVNTAAADYRLKSTSPCIDAGHPDEKYNDPDNTRNDMGAYYYRQPVDADDSGFLVPLTFALYQNYPNPFNMQTVISFSISRATYGQLTIYNIQGQAVRELVNGQISRGIHEVIWDGTGAGGEELASGVYFYRLKTADFTDTKKFILLK
jgi:hypothetical protein